MPEQLSVVRNLVITVCADPSGILGTRLMEAIRSAIPDFRASDFGCTNLRNFIEQHVPEVKIVGRSGTDYLYAPASAESRGQSTASLADGATVTSNSRLVVDSGSVWKAYASPNGRFKLYANTQDGQLVVCSPNSDQPSGPWVHIPPMPPEDHLALANEYVDSLPDEGQRERLRERFGNPNWWVSFYTDLKELGLDSTWNTLRRKRILGALEAALREAGIPAGRRAFRPSDRRINQAKGEPGQQVVRSTLSSARVRAIAIAIVQGMSLSELRDVRVRLGDVLDALDEA